MYFFQLKTTFTINTRKSVPLNMQQQVQPIWVKGTVILIEMNMDCKWKTLNAFLLFIGWASSKVPQQTIMIIILNAKWYIDEIHCLIGFMLENTYTETTVLEINVKGVILQVTQNGSLLVDALNYPNALDDTVAI